MAFGRRIGSLFLTETQGLNCSGPVIHEYPLMAGSVSTRRRQEADLGGHSPWRRLQAAALVGQGYLVEIEAETELDTEA